MSPLDNLEYTARGLQEFGGKVSASIELTREAFNVLAKEIEEEYDFTTVKDVKIVPEPNVLSGYYGVLLHGVRFTFYIKD